MLTTAQAVWLSRQHSGLNAGARVLPGAVLDGPPGSIRIGPGSTVHNGVTLVAAGGAIRVGRNCSINPGCLIYGHGGLTIGDNVRIAGNTVIIPANHLFDDVSRPICEQGERSLGIVIEDDVWIGAGVVVLDGVTIERGCVIGAGAIVTKSTEKNGVYVGNPARLTRYRGRTDA